MTREEYLKRREEREAELKAQGLAEFDGPLEAEYQASIDAELDAMLAITLAEMAAQGLPMAQDYAA